MRARLYGVLFAIASASLVSCTALLGLSDKMFEGGGGHGGATASASSMSGKGGAGGGSSAPTVWAIQTDGSPGGSAPSIGGVAVDSQHNIWITGTFTSMITVGSCAGSSVLGNNHAVFVAHLDAQGDCKDVFVFQGNGAATDDAWGNSIAIDPIDRNPVIVGKFKGTLTFDQDKNPTESASTAAYDAFAVKIDSSGNAIWATSFGNSNTLEEATDVAISPNGTVFVGGNYAGPFTPPNSNPLDVNKMGEADMFVIELTSDKGIGVRALGFGSTGADSLNGISTTPSGQIGLVGNINATMTLGVSPDDKTLNPPSESPFAAVINAAGTVCLFAVSSILQTKATGKHLAIDAVEKHVTLVGDLTGDLKLEPSQTISTDSNDPGDGFVIKLPIQLGSETPLIAQLGQQPVGGLAQDHLVGVAIDPSQNIVVAGTVGNKAQFQQQPLTSHGINDIFVAKLSPTFDKSWSYTFGVQGSSTPAASAVAVDPSDGSVIVAGQFDGSLDLGGSMPLSAGGGQIELFVMKLPP